MSDQANNQTSTQNPASTQATSSRMKALIGRKLGMTQIFTEEGTMQSVTLVQAGPCTVTALKSDEKDGYSAVQIGFEEAKSLDKAKTGHLKKSKSNARHLREVQGDFDGSIGDTLDVSVFEVGDKLTVTGTSKGKGFAGTIKRHNFSRGPMSHGSRNKRRPGSIGSMYPQKIFKGKKMAGRMGGDRVTVKGLSVAAIDTENNLLAVSGALPGNRNGIVILKGQA